jgi:predicted dehydrogenase
MVEQAVHVWDVFHWAAGGVPSHAFGSGRRDVFRSQPGRDVTDDYSAQLVWPGGFTASFAQSWAAPADEAFTGVSLRIIGREAGLDFATGSLTYRDRKAPRQSIHPGAQPDTARSLQAFVDAARSPEPPAPPVTLDEAREATVTGLMVRLAVDEGRVVTRAEILSSSKG